MARGGKRSNAGRKKLTNPKRLIRLYIRESIIKEYEGEEILKDELYKHCGQTKD